MVTLSGQMFQYISKHIKDQRGREAAKRSDTHSMPPNVDCGHFRGYETDERNILVDIDAFPDKVLSEPPHFVSAQVLVLECEFYIFRLA